MVSWWRLVPAVGPALRPRPMTRGTTETLFRRRAHATFEIAEASKSSGRTFGTCVEIEYPYRCRQVTSRASPPGSSSALVSKPCCACPRAKGPSQRQEGLHWHPNNACARKYHSRAPTWRNSLARSNISETPPLWHVGAVQATKQSGPGCTRARGIILHHVATNDENVYTVFF